MKQGSKANFTGKQFEKNVQLWLESTGKTPTKPPKYEAIWGTGKNRNQADKWLQDTDTQIELKYQSVPGTCDQKPFSELWNAHRRIKCNHYILILGGPHWDGTRGDSIYKEAKEMASYLSKTPASGAQKLSVFKYSEFKEVFNEQS